MVEDAIVDGHTAAVLMVWWMRTSARCHFGWIAAPWGQNVVSGSMEMVADSAFLTCWRLSHCSPLSERGVRGELVTGICGKSLALKRSTGLKQPSPSMASHAPQ